MLFKEQFKYLKTTHFYHLVDFNLRTNRSCIWWFYSWTVGGSIIILVLSVLILAKLEHLHPVSISPSKMSIPNLFHKVFQVSVDLLLVFILAEAILLLISIAGFFLYLLSLIVKIFFILNLLISYKGLLLVRKFGKGWWF